MPPVYAEALILLVVLIGLGIAFSVPFDKKGRDKELNDLEDHSQVTYKQNGEYIEVYDPAVDVTYFEPIPKTKSRQMTAKNTSLFYVPAEIEEKVKKSSEKRIKKVTAKPKVKKK